MHERHIGTGHHVEELQRQEQMQNAIGKVVNEMHVKLGITSSEAVAALQTAALTASPASQ